MEFINRLVKPNTNPIYENKIVHSLFGLFWYYMVV